MIKGTTIGNTINGKPKRKAKGQLRERSLVYYQLNKNPYKPRSIREQWSSYKWVVTKNNHPMFVAPLPARSFELIAVATACRMDEPDSRQLSKTSQIASGETTTNCRRPPGPSPLPRDQRPLRARNLIAGGGAATILGFAAAKDRKCLTQSMSRSGTSASWHAS